MGDRRVRNAVSPRTARAAAALLVAAVAAVAGLDAAAANPGETFVVNSTADALDARPGDGSCATSSGACTLRAAVQEANALAGADAIEVPAGTYAIAIPPSNQNDITTGDLDITDSVAINGAGAPSTIVDAGTPPSGAPPEMHGLDRLFEVSVDGGAVSFTGLTLSNGYAAEYGGAIANNSTATVGVHASVLTRNVAGKAGGAIHNHLGGNVDVSGSSVTFNFATESGSAINNNRDGVLTVTDSTVSSNSGAAAGLDEALTGGGAISNDAQLDLAGKIVVSGSTLADNHSGGGRAGGAIANDGAGSVTVDVTTFTKNVATGDGGAIFNKAGDVTVAGSTFTENAATNGGGIYNDGGLEGRVTVRDSRFSLNSATARGGAAAGGGTGLVEVFDSSFSKNSSGDYGGAVLSEDKGSTTIVRSSFTENSGLSGGGFANEGGGPAIVEDTTFSNNTAFEGLTLAAGEGGGMHSNSGGEVSISGGAFTGNAAQSGGGLGNEGGGTLSITGTRFTDNHADELGGGILIQSGGVSMVGIDVVGNVADGAEEGGGGIAYAGDKAIAIGETAALKDSRVRDNKAKGQGGGIDSRGDGPLVVTTTSITGNSAAIGGAIHHVGDAPLEVTRSTLSGNFAENGGGVFSDGDGEAVIENTTISTNRAGEHGGGLLVSSRLTLRSSTVASNTAASGGGIDNGGGDLVGDGLAFLANTIVANSPTGGNCAGTITSLGGNIDSGDTCRLRELTDQPGTDPRLGPLAENGGPTQTHALLEGSPAQERAFCGELAACPLFDQRGVLRPQFLLPDVGAYESPLLPGGGTPQPCTGRTERPVMADISSWISQSAPGVNFGLDSILNVEDPARRALVHFALPSPPPGCRLVGATLRLFSSAATDGRTLQALRLASSWSRLGVTWNNQPATAGAAATTESGIGLREWDVFAQTSDMYAQGNHGFLIRSAPGGGTGQQSFHGSLHLQHPPELVLVFDDPDAPPQPGDCPTNLQRISADRDSWISESSPSNNFGLDSALKIKSQSGSNSRALVRFPLPPLPPGCTGIASAALRVEAASAKEGRTLEALQVASAWTETGVTWANRPATTGPAAATPSAQGPLEWNVTEQILNSYVTANHGLLIRDAAEGGPGDEQSLNSREKIADGPPELVLVFDGSTPETTIVSGPPSTTDSTEATFVFGSDRDDAAFECSLDGAPFAACSSPHRVGGLAEGDHTFEVRSTRKVRAVDPTPARYAWGIAIPPETTIGGPASPSDSADATLTFAADDPDATFECSRNGAAFAPCTSPLELTQLPDGTQEVRVRGVDPFGNVDPTPAHHAWLVAVPPEVTIVRAPADPSNDSEPSFDFTAADNGPGPLTFECRLDGPDWAPCASAHGVGPLLDGAHTFEVRATDAAGNVSAVASHAWAVDTVAPTVTIEGPPDPTSSTSASFKVETDEAATLECALDSDAFGGCAAEYADLPDGLHALHVRATDTAGNPATATYSWTVDTVAPAITISGPPNPTNGTTASFTFEADEPAELACALDADPLGECRAEYADLGEGEHTFRVRAIDAAGNEAEAEYVWTIDMTAPVVTLDAVPADPSNEAWPTFEFSTEPDAGIECSLDGVAIDRCGSPQTVGPLTDGTHTFEVSARDAAGNVGAASHAWTVDTTAPAVTLDSVPADPGNETSPSIEFSTEPDAGIVCSLDGVVIGSCGSPQPVGPLDDGPHTFEVSATDPAGNTGAAEYSWTVDTVAPEVTLDDVPANPSNEASPAIEFSTEPDARIECALDGVAVEACASPQPLGSLADGRYTFEVSATDAAGNTGSAAHAWAVDTVAPEVTLDDVPADPSNAASPAIEFSTELGARIKCVLDGVAIDACASPQTVGPLPDGTHTFEVRATDAAGNTGPAVLHTWTVDTVAPKVTLDSVPPDPSNDPKPSFEFSTEPDAHVTCTIDGAAIETCASPQAVGPLADAPHTIEVRATDAAGNTGTAGYTWTVDTSAPVVSLDSVPADLSNEASPTIEFSTEPVVHVACSIDGLAVDACASPQAVGPLADGPHTFAVSATDAAGNTSTAAYTWTVDTVAPEVTLDAVLPDPSRDASPTFKFSSELGAHVACTIDGVAIDACASPQPLGPLADGGHKFEVTATDAAGNTGTATYTWIVDTSAPAVTFDSAPADPSNDASPTFEFSTEPGARLECSIDGEAIHACASPQTVGPLADGSRSFEVTATDAAGNTGTATYTWTVDTSAPSVTLDRAPADPSNDASPTFEFSTEARARPACSIDGRVIDACASSQAVGPLADGRHTFSVNAADAAGNTGTATYTWTVDTSAPAVTFDSAPADPSNDASPTLEFSTEAGARVACSFDDLASEACASPQALGPLADGRHSFQVSATDAAGNTGTVAHSWTVDTVAPSVTLDSVPSDPSNEASPTFAFSSESGAKLECGLDSSGWQPCESPHRVGQLAEGAHTLAVRATDAAGNTGPAAGYTWTIDTVAPMVTLDSVPPDPSNDPKPTFAFSTEPGARVECSVDGEPVERCASPQALGPLADGTHTFEVSASDAAGNTGAATRAWTVDTTAPVVTLDHVPGDPSNEASPTFEFSTESGARIGCAIDELAIDACASPQTVGPLADAPHTFEVSATDAAGNTATAAHTWTVDTVAPAATIVSAPSDPSDDRSPTFVFTSEPGAGFECLLDDGGWVACASPHRVAPLADGAHTFQVRATDAAGNTGAAAVYTWRIETTAPDTTPPDTTLTDAPPALSRSASASFSFSGSDAETAAELIRFECRLDSQAAAGFAACESPRLHTALSEGSHHFDVRAVDAAGNVDQTPASHTWTVDTVAPQTTIDSGPSGLTGDSTPTFGFSSEQGASFQCRVDAGAFTACTSPHTTAALTDGAHTFEVRATDAAGNTDATAASRTITVDTTAPQTTIDSGPSGPTNDSTPTFAFLSEPGASFQCRIDSGAFAACASPHTTAALANDAHTFEVRATDAAGNTDATPASRAITVDTTVPQTTITNAPPATTTSTTAQFAFNASETGSTFECSLDGAAFADCTSPQTYTGLATGAHTFSVRARDAAGNVDATPAAHNWTITAPQQGCGPAVTAVPAADAWIDENSPSNNKGTDSILKVQSKGPQDNFRALVRFTLPAVPQGCAIESATLRLFAASAKTPRTLHALRVADPWTENQVKWSNQPATIGAPAPTAAGTGYREWSVTSQVQEMYVGANNGFLIRDAVEGQDAEQQFHSREKGESPPQLMIRFAAASP